MAFPLSFSFPLLCSHEKRTLNCYESPVFPWIKAGWLFIHCRELRKVKSLDFTIIELFAVLLHLCTSPPFPSKSTRNFKLATVAAEQAFPNSTTNRQAQC